MLAAALANMVQVLGLDLVLYSLHSLHRGGAMAAYHQGFTPGAHQATWAPGICYILVCLILSDSCWLGLGHPIHLLLTPSPSGPPSLHQLCHHTLTPPPLQTPSDRASVFISTPKVATLNIVLPGPGSYH